MWKTNSAWSYESFKFDSSQTYVRLLLLLPELSEVISNLIRAMDFYISKSTGRNLAPQNLIQDWPLTSRELNVCPQDLLSSSGLHCSPGFNKIQKSSVKNHFISSIAKGSVLWKFGSIRLLGIESFGGLPSNCLQQHRTTFAETLFPWRFLKACLHSKCTVRYFPEESLCSWPDLESIS